MSIAVERVDPFEEGRLREWYAVYRASADVLLGPAESDHVAIWSLRELRELYRAEEIHDWREVWAGRSGDRLVAIGVVSGGLLDNLDRCEFRLHVHPDHRRRGHGSALLAHLEERVRSRGRTILAGESTYPYDAGPDGHGAPGPEFLRARGYALGLADVQRVLRLPVPEERLDRLAAEAAPYHSAYRFRTFIGPVPDDVVEEFARLAAAVMTEAPTGDLTLEPGKADVPALRAGEATLRRQGRLQYSAMAFAADGTAAGYTDLVTAVGPPVTAFQWGTLVTGVHRGHRLGMALKIANLRQLQADRDDVPVVRTWNAESNRHMVSVNEELGFEPVARLGEFQKRL